MNQEEKWAKTIDKNIKMVNKYTKKCSTHWQSNIKTIWYYFSPTKLPEMYNSHGWYGNGAWAYSYPANGGIN